MTDFNNIARSQAQASGDRQFYDSQRYGAMRDQGQALQGIGETVQRNRQMGLQEEVARSQMQAMQRELAMQQTDTDMRLQQHQQQMQLNQYKLAQLAQVNQADMATTELRAAKAQATLLEVQAQEAQRKFQESSPERTTAMFKAQYLREFGGVREAHSAGLIVDPDSPFGMRLPKDGEEGKRELAEQEKRIQGARDYSDPSLGVDPDTRAQQTINGLLNAAQKADDSDNPELADRLRQRANSIGGVSGKSAPRRAAAPAAPKLSPGDRMAVDSWSNTLTGMTKWAGGDGIPKAQADAIAGALYASRDEIRTVLKNNAATGRDISGDSADVVREVVAAIGRDQQTPMKDAALAWLVRKGVLTPQEADALWGTN